MSFYFCLFLVFFILIIQLFHLSSLLTPLMLGANLTTSHPHTSSVTGEHAEGPVGHKCRQPSSVPHAAVHVHPPGRPQGAHPPGNPHAVVHVAGPQSRRRADFPGHPLCHTAPHHTCKFWYWHLLFVFVHISVSEGV